MRASQDTNEGTWYEVLYSGDGGFVESTSSVGTVLQRLEAPGIGEAWWGRGVGASSVGRGGHGMHGIIKGKPEVND